MGLILLIILLVLLIGSVPTWPYSRGWVTIRAAALAPFC